MFAGGTATAEPAAQGTPCVALLSDLCVYGDVERGKKEAWRPAGGKILEAEPGFSALSVDQPQFVAIYYESNSCSSAPYLIWSFR